MKQKQPSRAFLVLPVAAILVLLLDQLTKHLVLANLDVGQSWEIAPWLAPVFRITHVTNTGAAFGLFPQWGDLFMVVAAVVVVTIFVYHWNLPDGQWLMRVALGLQFGGAVGNLIDRLRQGFVTDFIDLGFWPLKDWPVFNLADSSIVTGVALLTLLLILEERKERLRERVAQGG